MIKKEFRKDRVELTRLYKEFLKHDDFSGTEGNEYFLIYWDFLFDLSIKYRTSIIQIMHTMNV